MAETRELAAISSTILAVTSPDLYAINRESLLRLADIQDFEGIISQWGWPCHVVSVLCNRATPLHRDRLSGHPEFMEVLFSIGGDSTTVLELKSLGGR